MVVRHPTAVCLLPPQHTKPLQRSLLFLSFFPYFQREKDQTQYTIDRRKEGPGGSFISFRHHTIKRKYKRLCKAAAAGAVAAVAAVRLSLLLLALITRRRVSFSLSLFAWMGCLLNKIASHTTTIQSIDLVNALHGINKIAGIFLFFSIGYNWGHRQESRDLESSNRIKRLIKIQSREKKERKRDGSVSSFQSSCSRRTNV